MSEFKTVSPNYLEAERVRVSSAAHLAAIDVLRRLSLVYESNESMGSTVEPAITRFACDLSDMRERLFDVSSALREYARADGRPDGESEE